jgi:broad specificity phosphatase PhoE
MLLACGLWAKDTQVILVRHAEKVSEEKDAVLSDTGKGRAAALAGELFPAAPTALYATERRRTQQTLEPLAARSRLTIQVKHPADSKGTAAEILLKHRGKVVVVCGHSDTLGEIAAGLGFRGAFPVVTGYDRIWTLDLPKGSGQPVLKERVQAFRP